MTSTSTPKLEYEIVASNQENHAGIKSPYNADFVKQLKKSVPGCKWNSSSKVWFFEKIHLDTVLSLANEFWPNPETLNTYLIDWGLDGHSAPKIDGVEIINLNRDSWTWRNNCPFTIKPIEVDIKTGGSRRNPTVEGKFLVEVKLREGAQLTPEPDSMEIINEATQKPNPLESFSDDDLIKELIRRNLLPELKLPSENK